MEWAKLGVGVIKMVIDARTNTEFVQATSERDLYKNEVDRLNARLDRMTTPRNTNGNRNFHGNKSANNKGDSSGSKGFSKSSTKNPGSQGKSSDGPKYQGKNFAGQGTHSSQSFQKTSSKTSGAFNGSGGNNCKSQSNAFGVNSSSGRGNLQKKGHGRGRGNTRN